MTSNSFISILGAIALLLPACSTEKRDADINLAKNSESSELMLDADYKKQVINKLLMAFSDEWMAYYQYWVAAKLVQGAKTPKVSEELMQHANDELRHAGMLAKRMIDLGGNFKIFPQDWHKIGGCPLDSITDTSVENVLKENIKGEQCAITFYQNLMDMVKDKDNKTYDMAKEILKDEIEHKQDLEKLLEMH